jgi:hypothetical protein
MANASEWAVGGHPLRLPFSATAMVGCSMNIRLPHRDGTMVNGALPGSFGAGPDQRARQPRPRRGSKTLSVHRTKTDSLGRKSAQ